MRNVITIVLGFSTLLATAVMADPQVTTDPEVSPRPVQINQTATFNVTAVSTTGAPLTYNWNFGDGTSASTTVPTTTHVYPTAGTYYMHLQVFDGGTAHTDSILPLPVIETPSFLQCGLTKTVGKLHSQDSVKDTLTISGFIVNAADADNPAGKNLTFNFLGFVHTFVLNKTGKGKASDGTTISFKVPRKFAGGKIPFQIALKKTPLFFKFATIGFNPFGVARQQVSTEIFLEYGDGSTSQSTVIGRAYLALIIPDTSVVTRAPNPNITTTGSGEILSN